MPSTCCFTSGSPKGTVHIPLGYKTSNNCFYNSIPVQLHCFILRKKKRGGGNQPGTGPKIVLISSTEELSLKLSLTPYVLGEKQALGISSPHIPALPGPCVMALVEKAVIKGMATTKTVLRPPWWAGPAAGAGQELYP